MARSTDSGSTTMSAPGEEPKRRRFGRKRKQRDPNNPGRVAQIRQVFAMTRRNDPHAVLWMLLVFLVVVAIALAIGLWIDMLWYTLILGIPLGVLGAVIVLGRRAERAAYKQIEGQRGASGAVLGSLRRGWFYDQEPVAAEAGGKVRGMRDLSNAALLFRAVGRPGVVLISEGPRSAAQRLTSAETRRIQRVVGPEVPVHSLRVGQDEGETRLSDLTRRMKKLDKKITKNEAIAVQQRLVALGRMKAPTPPGVDPRKARVDRRALRGR